MTYYIDDMYFLYKSNLSNFLKTWHNTDKTKTLNIVHEKVAFVSLKLFFYANSSLSMKCPIYKKSYLWNVLSMTCPINEMSYLWFCYLGNVHLWNLFLWNDPTSVRSQKKIGPDQYSRFDVYWSQTNRRLESII